MISLLSKANDAGLSIYAYIYLKSKIDGIDINKDIIQNFKYFDNKDSANLPLEMVSSLIANGYITCSNNETFITNKGKSLFIINNDKYLEVMKHYPTTLYLSGATYPAKVSDSKCISLLSNLDTNVITLDKLIEVIEYAKKENLINMKFDKFIESKFYESILEKMENNNNLNNLGIYDNNF